MEAINPAQISGVISCLDKTIALWPDYFKVLAMRVGVHTLQIGWRAEGQVEQLHAQAVDLA